MAGGSKHPQDAFRWSAQERVSLAAVSGIGMTTTLIGAALAIASNLAFHRLVVDA
jgi:hypothetical protein